jgi:hypothetical protein
MSAVLAFVNSLNITYWKYMACYMPRKVLHRRGNLYHAYHSDLAAIKRHRLNWPKNKLPSLVAVSPKRMAD